MKGMRFLVSLLVTICLVLGLAGGVALAAKKLEMQLWDWAPTRVKLLDKLAAEYTKLNPDVVIKPVLIDSSVVGQKLIAAAASGTAPVLSYVAGPAEMYEPLPTSIFPRSWIKNNFFGGVHFADAKSYNLPTGIMVNLIFRNTELWQNAGLGNVPKTWNDFRTAAKKLTKYDAQNKIQTAGGQLQDLSLLWMDLNYQFGGWLFSENGDRALIDTPEGRKAATLIGDMLNDRFSSISGTDNPVAFWKGTEAMRHQMTWFAGFLDTNYPKLPYDTFVVPTFDGNGLPARGSQYIELGIGVSKSASAAEKEAAFKFIKWLVTNDDYNLALPDVIGMIPAYRPFASNPRVTGDKVMKVVAQQLPYTVFSGDRPAWHYGEALAALANGLLKGQSPSEALKNAQKIADVRIQTQKPSYVAERAYAHAGEE